MILTEQQRDRLLQSAKAGCAILSVQDCLAALETITALQSERDALKEALKYARRFLEANEVDLSFIDSVLFPASGEPARKP